MSSDRDALKRRAAAEIARSRDLCVGVSHRIHAHPELGHEEEKASAWLTELLRKPLLERASVAA